MPSPNVANDGPRDFTTVSNSPNRIMVWSLPELPQMNAWTGAGSVFALFGNYYDHRAWTIEPQADAVAILHDWVAVGRDIGKAIERFKAEPEAKQLELF